MIGRTDVLLCPEVDISGIKRKKLDVPYGILSEFQDFDLYLPEGGGPFPLLFFIHGGAWSLLDKRDFQIEQYLPLIHEGYAIASVNYRLAGIDGAFPTGVMDCKDALLYIKANSQRLCIDPLRIGLIGESAGAYYVMMLATANENPLLKGNFWGEPSKDLSVSCAVAQFAPSNFLTEDEQQAVNNIPNNTIHEVDPSKPEASEYKLFGGNRREMTREWIKLASPYYSINKEMPPLFLQHGTRDCLVPWQQSRDVFEKVKEIAGEDKVILEIFEGAEHGDSRFRTAENIMHIKETFLDLYLK